MGGRLEVVVGRLVGFPVLQRQGLVLVGDVLVGLLLVGLLRTHLPPGGP